MAGLMLAASECLLYAVASRAAQLNPKDSELHELQALSPRGLRRNVHDDGPDCLSFTTSKVAI